MYTSNIGDDEWEVLEPLIPSSKSNELTGGRPVKYERRDIVNAILYIKTTGCQWRNLPKDFPYWKTVYHYFHTWSRDGTWEQLDHTLTQKCRVAQGREAKPSAGSIDAQSVKTTHIGGIKGYDAGKKVKGRKRHVLVDTLGYLMTVVVHTADIQDRDGAKLVLTKAKQYSTRLKLIWADGGYRGKLIDYVQSTFSWTLEIIKRSDDVKGFKVLPRRWVVERTFSWIDKSRRNSKDYEYTTLSAESFIHITMIHLMVRQLARGF